MSGIYLSGGTLRIFGDTGVLNEMSFKPNFREARPDLRYWGTVRNKATGEEVTYSAPYSQIKNVVIIAKADDKVWIDNPFNVPLARVLPVSEPLPPDSVPTIDVDLWTGYHANAQARIRVDMVSHIVPHVARDTLNNVKTGCSVELVGIGHFYVTHQFEELAAMLAAKGWGQANAKPYVYPVPTAKASPPFVITPKAAMRATVEQPVNVPIRSEAVRVVSGPKATMCSGDMISAPTTYTYQDVMGAALGEDAAHVLDELTKGADLSGFEYGPEAGIFLQGGGTGNIEFCGEIGGETTTGGVSLDVEGTPTYETIEGETVSLIEYGRTEEPVAA